MFIKTLKLLVYAIFCFFVYKTHFLSESYKFFIRNLVYSSRHCSIVIKHDLKIVIVLSKESFNCIFLFLDKSLEFEHFPIESVKLVIFFPLLYPAIENAMLMLELICECLKRNFLICFQLFFSVSHHSPVYESLVIRLLD